MHAAIVAVRTLCAEGAGLAYNLPLGFAAHAHCRAAGAQARVGYMAAHDHIIMIIRISVS